MSHLKERKEKICLNCGEALYGLYCHKCGQENIEPKHSAWHLVTHFFYDITHFDGKFFTTLKDLITKPGFLSREYINGRRASYLNPIRMYVFTSAFFFIIFFSIYHVEEMHIGDPHLKHQSALSLDKAMQTALEGAGSKEDSAAIRSAFSNLKIIRLQPSADSSDKGRSKDSTTGDININNIINQKYKTVEEYDSVQQALPVARRDGWLKSLYTRKNVELEEKYKDDKAGLLRNWIGAFMHNFPKMLFISLPIFALLLKLLYVRRKQFYYVDHGIFAIHLYIFTFIALLLYFAVQKIKEMTGWTWLSWLNLVLFILCFFYFYKAMRNFYLQGMAKTIVKYVLLSFLSFFVIIILFSVFFLFSIFEI